MFPEKGRRDLDRAFRAKPQKVTSSHSSPAPSHGMSQISVGSKPCNNAPTQEEVVDGFKVFVTSYFQLGFIPKAVYLEKLGRDSSCIHPFLLYTILGISARFTPTLIKRYGSAAKATDFFLRLVKDMIISEMYEPSLERVQAFFLLSITEWGNGDKSRSSIHMGIAVRMAASLKLHREETYRLEEDASAEDMVEKEMARRTFWMIQSQDNLHSGHGTPLAFSPLDITALLPSDESDFVFGTRTMVRAALPNTPPALSTPSLVFLPSRSLFATLIQAHNLWGMVARRASRIEENLTAAPWKADSEYTYLSGTLREWENNLPERHRWSVWNLRGYKAESQDLAFLSIVMVVRLSNIVLRRVYLEELIEASRHKFTPEKVANANFWGNMSGELFHNVVQLHKQIEVYFPMRNNEQGYPAILVFCIHVCGALASHLWKRPQLCPHLACEAEQMARVSLSLLVELQHAWPTATKWLAGLKHFQKHLSHASSSHLLQAERQHKQTRGAGDPTTMQDFSNDAQTSPDSTQQPFHIIDDFEVDFAAFVAGDLNYGIFDAEHL